MRIARVLKWILSGIGILLGIAVVAVGAVYVIIGSDLAKTFDREGTVIAVSDDDAVIEEGARLARLRGCFGGCHGETVNGQVFGELPDGSVITAPDLSAAAANYTIEELENLIRHGIRPDGRSLIVIMPSSMFYNLSDEDLGAILSFVQAQPMNDLELPGTELGPAGRAFMYLMKQIYGTILAAEEIDHDAERIPPTGNDGAPNGEYLAKTICTECHGLDLRGDPDGFAPTLALAVAYTPDDFRRLMAEGVPIGDRELELMSEVAISRFSHFTDDEIEQLHGYLVTLADQGSNEK